MNYRYSKQTVNPGCAGFDGFPLRVAETGAAAGARLTEGPGTPPLRPRRSSLRRAALPGAGGRRLPHPGLRSSEAARLGVDFAEWSRVEHGRLPETEAGAAAWLRRLEEVALYPEGGR